jgi:hypothetical protein
MKHFSSTLFPILFFFAVIGPTVLQTVYTQYSSPHEVAKTATVYATKNKPVLIEDSNSGQQQIFSENNTKYYPRFDNNQYRLSGNQKNSPLSVADNLPYTLQNAATTSAGVFDGDVLIRTLWNNEKRNAGTYDLSTVWDGKDDNGNYVADKNYTIKVVSNNVTYEWLRPVGNTSDSLTGGTVHHAAQIMTSMVQAGTDMYYAIGYNEIGQVHSKFAVGAPNRITTTLRGGGQVIRFLAYDGNIVYSAGQRDGSTSFITGIVPKPQGTDALASFGSGTPYSMATGSPYTYSAFNITGNSDFITGLAVQQSGNYLVASHKTLNQVRVFNKTTGALVQTLTGITAPRELAISGSTLWVISGTNTVAKYAINANGTISQATLTLTGLTEPLSVAVSPDGNRLAVADRGTYHQVKFFNTSTGALLSTVGRAENYSNPTVYNDKFYFNNTRIFREDDFGTAHAFVAFQTDGSLWVGDYGNMRCQHFAADGSYIDNIQYMGYSYSSQTDINNPVRVFSDFLEFNVNYSTGSWTFVRNWSKNIIIPTVYDEDRMRSVVTLSNGRTYCLYNEAPGRPKEVLELVSTTGLRHTGVYLDDVNCELNADGSQWRIGTNQVGQPTFWKRKPLLGFDGNNNPQWGTYVTLETTPNVTTGDPLTADGYMKRQQQLPTGAIATYSADNGKTDRGRGYHLGAVKNGQWLFKTSPSTRSDYLGDYPADGWYDIGNGVNFAGSFMQVMDRNIFWGYKGEFWKAGQTNIYNHYLDNGLMVGQFGISGDIARLQGEAPPMMAGNSNSGTYVKVGDDIHFFHCDENAHGGVHHWKISNLNSIQEQSFSITKAGIPALPPLPYIDLMAGLPTSGAMTSGTGRWSYSPGTYTNAETNRWSVTAGLSTYKRDDRSVRFTSYPATNGLTRQGFCDLSVTPGTTNNLTSWQITGRLTYPEIAEAYDNFIDVLDNSDKVIVRISRPEAYPNVSVKANNTTIVSGALSGLIQRLFQNARDLSIRRSGSNVLVSYAGYPEVSVSVFDPAANLSSPTKLRIHQYSANTRGHQIDLANLKFYSTASTAVSTGTGTGLTGKYFNNKTLTDPWVAVRTDSIVNFTWGLASPLPGQLNADNFSIRWTGQVQAPVSGTYVFSTSCDDGVRLWVNGALVIDNWVYHSTIDNSAPIALMAGQKYDIRLEYYEGVGGASMRLTWAYPGQAVRQAIPKRWLYPSSSGGRVGSDVEKIFGEDENTGVLNSIRAYPVPAHDFLWINYYAKEAGDVSIRLVGLNAQSVLQSVRQVTQGENTLKIPVKEFARGVYLLNLTQGYRRVSQRVILSD